jgi:hypothetical protein
MTTLRERFEAELASTRPCACFKFKPQTFLVGNIIKVLCKNCGRPKPRQAAFFASLTRRTDASIKSQHQRGAECRRQTKNRARYDRI